MTRKHRLNEEQARLLDSAVERVNVAKYGHDQARRELGAVMRTLGFSASADHLDRSRQWAMKLAKLAEDTDARGTERGRRSLADSIKRFGVLEPITAEMVDEETLRIVDGHRRLRAAREAGISSLPVTVLLREPASPLGGEAQGGTTEAFRSDHDERTPNVDSARAAAAKHRLIRFTYRRPNGPEMIRTVDAWGVINRSGRWYLVGHDRDRDELRVFRIARILDEIRDMGSGDAPPEGFAAGAHVWGPLDPDIVEAMEAMIRNEWSARLRSLNEVLAESDYQRGPERVEV